MSRQEEFAQLCQELEEKEPDMARILETARARKRRKSLILRPLGSVAAAFAIFVLLVNYCAPVAYACSQVPVLRELAKAVTFSRSLSDAVEHDYLQELNLSQTQGDITAEIPYLIVDQKQVNIFYRLSSESGAKLYADPDVQAVDGEKGGGYVLASSGYGEDNGELRYLTLDYVTETVPDRLNLVLRVAKWGEEVAESQVFSEEAGPQEPDYLTEFHFLLEFDPTFTATGKIFPVGTTVELDGQKITVQTVEVYPSHLRLELADDPGNTAWLEDLDFYIQAENGMTFTSDITGITATGAEGSESMLSYRAESSFFYEAEQMSIVITGAQWREKSREKLHLNLLTGESDPMPEGVSFVEARREGKDWIVKLRCEKAEEKPMYQAFDHLFYDAEGNQYEINSWSTRYGDGDEKTWFYQEFPLREYPYDEVWLSPSFTHNWTPEQPITIEVQ